MPRSQTTANLLTKLFEHAPDPVYVLDDRRTIVFCNRALAAWTSVDARELVGRRVDYHSHVDTADAVEQAGVAVGLCPPPVAFTGEEATGHVSCMSKSGHLLHRRARFVPLGARQGRPRGDVDCHGVVVFLEPVDLEAGDLETGDLASAAAGEPTADQLHLAIRRFRRAQANRYEWDRLVGESPAIRKAREQVALAAENRASVLIVGPSGSGRSHVARAIHYHPQRDDPGKLVPVCCGRLGEEALRRTIDSATAKQTGDGLVTLLLENVDELPGESQVRLAALGDDKMRVRLISTTTRHLGDLADEGDFRKDLACALGTITIELPPLAERIEDLPVLAQMFLEEENCEGSKQIGGVTPEAMDLLASYPWPGGLDSLAEAIGAAHQSTDGPEITPADLPAKFHHAAATAARPRRSEEPIQLEEFLAEIETELIRRALARAGGNKTKTAKLLGMTRTRFYRRLVQLGLAEEGSND